MYYVTYEFLRNSDLIITRYKFKINIISSTKITLMVCTIFKFSCYARFLPLVLLDQFYVNWKSNFMYFFSVIFSDTVYC